MRLRRLLVGAATVGLAATGLGLVGPPAAEASCAGPQLSLEQGGAPAARSRSSEQEEFVYAVTAAQPLRVVASNLADGCQDTYSTTRTGCGPSTRTPVQPAHPLAELRLVLRQDGHRWVLARADAPSADLTLDFAVDLPAGARRGPAKLELVSKQGLGNSLQLRLG